jgi:hypothetical protein
MKNIDISSMSADFLSFCWANLCARDRAKILRGAARTVWIFGAGASCHYDLNASGVSVPLANGFFQAFHRLPTSRGFNAYIGPFIDFLRDYRGVSVPDVPKWNENIEDFMTSLERGIDELRLKKGKGPLSGDEASKMFSYAMTFNNMGFIFANVINEAQNGPTESLYRYLLDFCGPHDTFITFNWDTLLDRALAGTGGWNPNRGYGLRFKSVLDGVWTPAVKAESEFSTEWKLLKLHGSTNWLVPIVAVNFQTLKYSSTVPASDEIFLYWQSVLPYQTHKRRWRGGYVPTCYGFYPPNLPGKFFKSEHLAAPPGRVFVKMAHWGIFTPFKEPDGDGIPSSPVLITPVRQKKYDVYQTKINGLWNQAANLLNSVNRIVIVGYSFPPTDTRARELLGTALKARPGQVDVEIVAPDASSICARLGEGPLLKAKSVTPRDLTFEDYIQTLANNILQLIEQAAAEYKDFRDWIVRLYAMNHATPPTGGMTSKTPPQR